MTFARALLVLSGKDTRTTLAKAGIEPEFVCDNLAAIMADVH